MKTSEICNDEQRRHAVRKHINAAGKPDLNGIDYLEVSDDQYTLTVFFLGKAPEHIAKENVRIDGGRRIRGIQVVGIRLCILDDPDLDDCMKVTVDRPGDFSTYTLRLVERDEYGRPGETPLRGFDPRYARLQFSFKAGCPSDLDCQPQPVCPPQPRVEPEINYLAKDYASFRQLILDRLALIMPDWRERHVPDLGIALVEVLAYAGDHLSYYQDAVATEAYLETARQRISVRRHARLVDYQMHEGCNARAWVCVEASANTPLDLSDAYFITGYNQALDVEGNLLAPGDLHAVPPSQYEVFEPLGRETIQLYQAHSRIGFYTWGDRACCLPRGATAATLRDRWAPPQQTRPGKTGYQAARQQSKASPELQLPQLERELRDLKKGDILIFEEVIGPKTGNPADADASRRHAVRLTRVQAGEDPLYTQRVPGVEQPLPTPIVEIEWAAEDALPFPLCLSAIGPAPQCAYLEDISVARGNVVLVDHGSRVEDEALGAAPVQETLARCVGEGRLAETQAVPGLFRSRLAKAPLTFRQPLPAHAPAAGILTQDARRAVPQIELKSAPAFDWAIQRDLLGSQSLDYHFVAEIDDDGRAHLRFGDGELGRAPEAGMSFTAAYRVGNGTPGNVGAEAISHLVLRRTSLSGVTLRVRNPLPAHGGIDPEPLAEVRLFAPYAFRTDLQRAITADDYARLAERHPRVQRAAAALRWTGSWYEAQVAIDPLGAEEAGKELLREIRGSLHRYRRVGHDLKVAQADYVPLEIEMVVCVLPHHLRGHVKAALLDLFSNRALPDGRRGFFHPDNLTFGEGIYLSKLIAAAQAVTGVESVSVTKLERLYEGPNHELENGVLPLGPLEIAQLDNDPSFPEHGRLALDVRGGR